MFLPPALADAAGGKGVTGGWPTAAAGGTAGLSAAGAGEAGSGVGGAAGAGGVWVGVSVGFM
ncbi:hypothetical protein KW801_03555 [Candidatus Saccharibacteria bacterium]|nr:hypothetical protein [Candidatus Saccharibacteria bacterium]